MRLEAGGVRLGNFGRADPPRKLRRLSGLRPRRRGRAVRIQGLDLEIRRRGLGRPDPPRACDRGLDRFRGDGLGRSLSRAGLDLACPTKDSEMAGQSLDVGRLRVEVRYCRSSRVGGDRLSRAAACVALEYL